MGDVRTHQAAMVELTRRYDRNDWKALARWDLSSVLCRAGLASWAAELVIDCGIAEGTLVIVDGGRLELRREPHVDAPRMKSH
jgi:hypothetical protein